MSIACNKVKGVRCAKVHTKEETFLTRSHNNANVLAISAHDSIDLLKELVHTFITTPFSGEERHIRRIEEITEYENAFVKEWNKNTAKAVAEVLQYMAKATAAAIKENREEKK